jgi:salicylate hydroxylase
MPTNPPLTVLIIGGGLGGLGAAIATTLAGYNTTVAETAPTLSEVGAGIQILPNASKILTAWGLREKLLQHATHPAQVNMIGWKGNHITHMKFAEQAQKYNSPFWDFHRAGLQKCLLDRAIELGVKILTNARVDDVVFGDVCGECEVALHDGRRLTADLVIAADGINSRMRECLAGKPDPPTPTGDLAYRLLLNTADMMRDPDLSGFITDPQVNYWIGPDCHAGKTSCVSQSRRF